MSDFSLYSQSGGQLKKVPNTSTRKSYEKFEDAVAFALKYLTAKRWNNKSLLEMEPNSQILIMEYSGSYQAKIVGIVGKNSIKNFEINSENNLEENFEKNIENIPEKKSENKPEKNLEKSEESSERSWLRKLVEKFSIKNRKNS